MKQQMVRIGNFFFHYRNRVFPIIMLALFMIAVPPDEVFSSHSLEVAKDIIALLIGLAGLAFRGWVIGYVYIKRGGLNKQVYADNLVTSGIFGLCRNPLYVGNMLIYVGVFLMHGNPMVMVLGILSYAFIYQSIIYAEENYLRTKFGEAYDRYCQDVPRWIPNFSKFKESTEGMHFNLRRALIKDYSTITVTLITLALVEFYEEIVEYYREGSSFDGHGEIAFLIGFIGVCVVTAGTIRILKKKKLLVVDA